LRLYKKAYRDHKTGEPFRGKTWRVQFSVHGQRCDESTGLRDKRAAEIKAREIVRDAELRAAGVDTHRRTRVTGVQAIIEEYRRDLERRGRCRRYCKETASQLNAMIGDLKNLGACTPQHLRRRLNRLKDGEASARTRNLHRSAVRTFFGWLMRQGRWGFNPAAQVDTARVVEPKRERRALLPEEEARLLAAAPPHRALVYLTALRTGLRRGELGKMVWNDLALDADARTFRVQARNAKNRREAVLPLAPDAAAALRRERAARGQVDGAARVFPRVPGTDTLRRDLEAARTAWVEEARGDERQRRARNRDFLAYHDSDGRHLDFHALRVSFGTSLARAGVRLQEAQRLMRHSTPVLTANAYTKLELHDLRGAVERLDRRTPSERRHGNAAT
jgi:integrase